MNNPDPYQSWVDQKRRVEPPSDFVPMVMTRVADFEKRQREEPPANELIPRLLEWVARRRVAQAAALIGGFALGALRLLGTLQFLLSY